MYDARFFRMWEFYLAGGIVMFEEGSACNYQIQYSRDRRSLPITRDYMLEVERKYRELGAADTQLAKTPRRSTPRNTRERAEA
jgi:cyclopropane-fatty-acyl-phospholipid synthase